MIRFDLGKGGNPTLYGTERGLKATVKALQKTGGSVYIDYVINHKRLSRFFHPPASSPRAIIPAFVNTIPNGPIDGDYHTAFHRKARITNINIASPA